MTPPPEMSAVVEVLRVARAKIEKPENWTQGAYAKNDVGHSVEAVSRRAVSWCAFGAIAAVTADSYCLYNAAMVQLESITNELSIGEFNDNHTHVEVLAAFDAAIAKADAKPAHL